MPVAFHQVCPIGFNCVDPITFLVTYSRQIIGIIHTQHIEQVFTGKFTESLSTNLFDDILQSNEVQTAVATICLRFELTLASLDVFQQSFRTWRTVLFFQLCCRAIGRKTGSMCQQIGYTDSLLFFSIFACPILESWNIHTDCIAQANLSSFHQNHGTNGCRHGLATGCHIEDCFCSHWFHSWINTLIAVGFQVCHLTVTNYRQYSARDILVGNGSFNDFVCIHQSAGIHSHLFGSHADKRLGNRLQHATYHE